jgi:flagellar motor switch protein FliN/FliY
MSETPLPPESPIDQKLERNGTENLRVRENIDVQMTVEVGRSEITIRDLLRLTEGSI